MSQRRKQIRAAWDVLTLERDVALVPQSMGLRQPTKQDHRHTVGKPFVVPADAVYVVGTPVPLHPQGALVLDELCQRHLEPLQSRTPD